VTEMAKLGPKQFFPRLDHHSKYSLLVTSLGEASNATFGGVRDSVALRAVQFSHR
jgi:hypothetical protein